MDELDAVDGAYAMYFPTVVERTGGTVDRRDGLVLWAGLHESPFVVNGAVRLGDDRTPAEDLLRTVAEFFDERRHGHTLTVRSHRDPDLEAAALAAGYRSFFELELMVCDEPPPEPHGIRLAETPDDVAAFEQVTAAAYGVPDVIATVCARPEAFLAPDTRTFLAFEDGEPVAAAVTHVAGDVGGIYWVGAVEAARRRGLGGAVSAAATRAGFELGARLMTLEATPIAVGVYRELGYRSVGAYRLLVPGD